MMNWMMKTLALLMTVMLCLTMAYAEDAGAVVEEADVEIYTLPDSFTSSVFADESGEWGLEMQWFNNGLMYLSVEHRIGEEEAEIWSIEIEGAYDGDEFSYNGAIKAHATMDAEDGTLGEVETVYEDGTGSVALDGELLTWRDDALDEAITMGLLSSSTTMTFTDSVYGKAVMRATSHTEDNAELECVIECDMSDTETRVWTMLLVWSDVQNLYVYENAECNKIVENGEELTLETLYSNGHGTFAMMSDGSLLWDDQADSTGSGYRFVENMISF